jgi:hypothetical protein
VIIMKNARIIPCLLVLVAGVSACGFHARGPADYASATRAVLETRSVLKQDKAAAGTVVVHFTVMPETGAITGAEVTPESSAPAPLGQCIVTALEGLTLDPPDAREGDATFSWDFKQG